MRRFFLRLHSSPICSNISTFFPPHFLWGGEGNPGPVLSASRSQREHFLCPQTQPRKGEKGEKLSGSLFSSANVGVLGSSTESRDPIDTSDADEGEGDPPSPSAPEPTLISRGVAVQVEFVEKANFETGGFHFIGAGVEETRRFRAGTNVYRVELDSTCTPAPPEPSQGKRRRRLARAPRTRQPAPRAVPILPVVLLAVRADAVVHVFTS
jgi:hypothetical protein